MKFQDLPLNERVLRAIEELGYEKASEIQEKAIPEIAQGNDMIGIAQTGTGKTAAFLLPILSSLCEVSHEGEHRHTKVLVLSPTRELAAQIYQSVRDYGKFTNLRAVLVTGGAGESKQIGRLNSAVDVVIATPGRLHDFTERKVAQFDKLEFLVIDEADRMLDMGFLPAVTDIIKPLPKKRQTLLFSATFLKPLEKLAKTFMKHPKLVEIGSRSNPADTVTQYLYPVKRDLKVDLLLKMLDDHMLYAVIIFVRTRVEVDKLTKILRQEKIDAESIHGDKRQQTRRRTLEWFKKGKLRVLVATDVASRGLDIEGVTHVINFDFPEQNDDYIHRIGRTGRAGETGEAITFLTPQDEQAKQKLERHIGRTLKVKKIEKFDYNSSTSSFPDYYLKKEEVPIKKKRSKRKNSTTRPEEKNKPFARNLGKRNFSKKKFPNKRTKDL